MRLSCQLIITVKVSAVFSGVGVEDTVDVFLSLSLDRWFQCIGLLDGSDTAAAVAAAAAAATAVAAES